ncbi:MAG: GtrA family protein [Ahniella sp.]|nr:GtrA family protein [Ahniella sp.]
MTMSRQFLSYLLIGGTQFLLDWALFSLLFWLGVPVVAANLGARASAAMVGFVLNGRITFADAEGGKLGGRRLARFIVAWVLMTLVSTLLVQAVEWIWPGPLVYLAKPVVEAMLALVNFFVLKWFVYR